MAIKKLAKLVEIQTKAASMIPFAIGTLYAIYHYDSFSTLNFLLMFLSLICIDMATTAINNYYDYKKAQKRSGYGYETHNAIVRFQMKESTVITVIGVLFVTAVVAGILLVTHTNVVVLGLGALSFAIGILYSFGPIPISRLPLGELFSGLFMGFLIIFISAYIHTMDAPIIDATFSEGVLGLAFDLPEIALVFVISIPAILGIANIMLANNICDMEEDIVNKRYTLPIYIGKSKSLQLFHYHYLISYVDVLALFALGVHPVWLALILLTYIPLRRNIKRFTANPSKAETFALAVKSFLLICAVRVTVLGLSILWF